MAGLRLHVAGGLDGRGRVAHTDVRTRPPGLHALAGIVPVPAAELAGPADDPPPF